MPVHDRERGPAGGGRLRPEQGACGGDLTCRVLGALRHDRHPGDLDVGVPAPGGRLRARGERRQAVGQRQGPVEVSALGPGHRQGFGDGSQIGVRRQGDGTFQQHHGRTVRPRREHPPARLRELERGPRPIARRELQRGHQLPSVLVERLPRLLHRGGGTPGECGALGRCERGDQRLGGEGVTEGVAVGGRPVGGDHTGLDRRPEMGEQGPVLQSGDGLEHRHGELAAQGRRRQQQVTHRFVHAVQPVGPAAQDARREGAVRLVRRLPAGLRAPQPAGVEEVVEQHLDQIGVARRAFGQTPLDRLGYELGRCLQAGPGQGPHVRVVEPA